MVSQRHSLGLEHEEEEEVVSNLVILAYIEMETGAGHDLRVVKETRANWSEPI